MVSRGKNPSQMGHSCRESAGSGEEVVGGSTDSGRVGGETGDVLGGEDDLGIGVQVGEVLAEDGDAKPLTAGFFSNYNGMTINKFVRIPYKQNHE